MNERGSLKFSKSGKKKVDDKTMTLLYLVYMHRQNGTFRSVI